MTTQEADDILETIDSEVDDAAAAAWVGLNSHSS